MMSGGVSIVVVLLSLPLEEPLLEQETNVAASNKNNLNFINLCMERLSKSNRVNEAKD